MQRWIGNSKYLLMGVFLTASAAAAAYDWWFIWPAQKCDQSGDWWDPKDHQCLSPMPIWRITGHLPTSTTVTPAKPAGPKG